MMIPKWYASQTCTIVRITYEVSYFLRKRTILCLHGVFSKSVLNTTFFRNNRSLRNKPIMFRMFTDLHTDQLSKGSYLFETSGEENSRSFQIFSWEVTKKWKNMLEYYLIYACNVIVSANYILELEWSLIPHAKYPSFMSTLVKTQCIQNFARNRQQWQN